MWVLSIQLESDMYLWAMIAYIFEDISNIAWCNPRSGEYVSPRPAKKTCEGLISWHWLFSFFFNRHAKQEQAGERGWLKWKDTSRPGERWVAQCIRLLKYMTLHFNYWRLASPWLKIRRCLYISTNDRHGYGIFYLVFSGGKQRPGIHLKHTQSPKVLPDFPRIFGIIYFKINILLTNIWLMYTFLPHLKAAWGKRTLFGWKSGSSFNRGTYLIY